MSSTPAHRDPGDDLTIAGEIARGGMGIIYRALDRRLERDVAMKVLADRPGRGRDGSGGTSRTRDRFLAEARINGRLEHPNIVPVHTIGADPAGRPYFTMKLVRGRSLADLLADRRRGQGAELGMAGLLGLFLDVCNAVAYAHSQGIIHRDLKPANIMVGDFGETLVMDWGLARVLRGQRQTSTATHRAAVPDVAADDLQTLVASLSSGGATEDGVVEGTPCYMPPEQARGDIASLDERSDVYALGAILYEMLCLRPPVGGPHVRAILDAVLAGRIVPPSDRVPERAVSPELSAVAMRCLASDPAARYATVAALKQDIERFLEHRAVSARPDTAWQALVKLVRRNRGAAIATGVAGGCVAVVIAVAFVANWQARIDADQAREIAEAARTTADAERSRAQQSLDALRKEQTSRQEEQRTTAPALVEKARRAMERRDFDDALADIDLALQFDRGLASARLLRGMLLAASQGDPRGALPEIDLHLSAHPEDIAAVALRDALAQAGDRPSPAQIAGIAEALYGLGARTLAERVRAPGQELLGLWRARVDAAWPKAGLRITANRDGDLEILGLPNRRAVSTLSPLAGLPVARIDLAGTSVTDLAPLTGAPLAVLDLSDTPVADLAPLAGAPLVDLRAPRSRIVDLAAMPVSRLEILDLSQTAVADLAPLARARALRKLLLRKTAVRNLAPLAGLPVAELDLSQSGISDLADLRGCASLSILRLQDNQRLTDLSPLAGLPLTQISMDKTAVADLSPLRAAPLTVISLHDTPVVDLSPLAGKPIRDLSLVGSPIEDLVAVAALADLLQLTIDRTRVTSLAPLAGRVQLAVLSCKDTAIQDLTPLIGMKLVRLHLARTGIDDISAVSGMPLTSLDIRKTRVHDLSPLTGIATLRELDITDAAVTDLTPLVAMALGRLTLSQAQFAAGKDVLRRCAGISHVQLGGDGNDRPIPLSEALRRADSAAR
jgi:Leucine-rich repeat (LRR) protein/tRNA A-37 threonylcarbamoyl transferase component Bud32